MEQENSLGRKDKDREIRDMKKKINFQLLLSIMVVVSLGHLIPVDFKVVYGFCTGMAVGVFLFPRLMEAKLREDINNMWKCDNKPWMAKSDD